MKLNVCFNSTETDLPVCLNSDYDVALDMGSVMEVTTSDHNELRNRDLPDQHPIDAITGLREAINSIPEVLYDTTANWNSYIDYIPPRGAIIVYSDYAYVPGAEVPNFKIGDGLAYLVDLPFVEDDLRYEFNEHIHDNTVHITAAERANWNNKVSCSVSQISGDEYLLTFSV